MDETSDTDSSDSAGFVKIAQSSSKKIAIRKF